MPEATSHIKKPSEKLDSKGKPILWTTECCLSAEVENMSSFSFLLKQRLRKSVIFFVICAVYQRHLWCASVHSLRHRCNRGEKTQTSIQNKYNIGIVIGCNIYIKSRRLLNHQRSDTVVNV